MKCAKYLLLPLAIACLNIAHADDYTLPAKHVAIPFSNVPIFSKEHDGLFFNYNMNGLPVKKIVCTLSSVYKGWLEFPDQGVIRGSGVYGDGDSATITLTNKGKSIEDQYHADMTGIVRVKAVKYKKGARATATCYYEADNNK